MTTKALVILSGGQDSTTCLFWAKQHFEEVHAITFDYNQRHSIEIEAAKKVAEMAGVASHEIVQVPNCLAGKSFLTDLSAPVEKFESFEGMEHHNAFKENKLDSSFVPMRNALFLTIAANRAAVLDCDCLITGVTAADFAEFGEFSWDWLGGFIDAEGYIGSTGESLKSYRLSVYQSDPELLHRIGKWVEDKAHCDWSVVICNGNEASLNFNGTNLDKIIPFLAPHLHLKKRREQLLKFAEILPKEAPISMGYITGFWEGDGGAYGHIQKNPSEGTKCFELSWFQKYPEILKNIKKFLQKGYLRVQDEGCRLRISDGPLTRNLWNQMLPHVNVLGSFEKVAKNFHKIGLPSGGFNPPYPDCTPDFIWSIEAAINEALLSPGQKFINIETPVMFLTKAQSVYLAYSLPGCWDAMAYTHTSYNGEYPPLNPNHANLLRAKGFETAGLPDPLVVRAWREGLMALPMTANYDCVRGEGEFK